MGSAGGLLDYLVIDDFFCPQQLNEDEDDDDGNDDIIAQPPRTLGLIFFDFISCLAESDSMY